MMSDEEEKEEEEEEEDEEEGEEEEEEEEETIKCGICAGIVDLYEIECLEDLSCVKCSAPFPCSTHEKTAHATVDYTSAKDIGEWCPRCDGVVCVACGGGRCPKCPPIDDADAWGFCWECAQKHGCTNKIFSVIHADTGQEPPSKRNKDTEKV